MIQKGPDQCPPEGHKAGGPFVLGKHGCCFDDNFMIYEFKMAKCLIVQPHVWRNCPFVHPGEPVQRRHPSLYQGDLCPAVKQGKICPHGPEKCSYAHNAFEAWLHPEKFKTIMCRKGANCNRDICFFAHSAKELRSPTKSRPLPPPDPSADVLAAYSQWVTGGTSQMPETSPLSLQVPSSASLAVPPSVSLGLPVGTSSSCDLGPLVSLSAPSLPCQQPPAVLPLVQGPLVALPPILPGQQAVRPLVPARMGSNGSSSRSSSAQLPSSCSSSSSNAGAGTSASSSSASWPAQVVQQGFSRFQSFPPATATAEGTAANRNSSPFQLPVMLQTPASLHQTSAAAAATNSGSNMQMAAANAFMMPAVTQQQLLADLSVIMHQQQQHQQQQLVPARSKAHMQQQQQFIGLPAANRSAADSPSASSSSSSSSHRSFQAGLGELSGIESLLSGLNLDPAMAVSSGPMQHQHHHHQQQQQFSSDAMHSFSIASLQSRGLYNTTPLQPPCSWAAATGDTRNSTMLQPVMHQQGMNPAVLDKVTHHMQCAGNGLGQQRTYKGEWLVSGLGI